MAAGLAYLKFGEMSIYNLSPPLLRMWTALPAFYDGAVIPDPTSYRALPEEVRHWAYFNEFQSISVNLPRLHRFVLLGRSAAMLFSVTGAILIFTWTRRTYGAAAGLVACSIWCFSPTIIANGSTLGTDIATALALFVAIRFWTQFLKAPSIAAASLAGGFVALAHAMKFTALVLWPAMLILGIVAILRDRKQWRMTLAGFAAALILTYLLLNLTYGFQRMGHRLDSFAFVSAPMKALQRSLPSGLRVPLNHDMLMGFDMQEWETQGAYFSTLFDRGYYGNDWRYYPWILLTKSTVGELALLLIAAASFFIRRPTYEEVQLLIALATFGFFILVVAKINIGIRYLLPLYLPSIMLIARVATFQRLRFVAFAAAGLIAIETTLATPRFRSFVNIPARPWKMAVPDQDGGQGLLALRDWMRKRNMDRINLVYFGTTMPEAYGITNATFAPLPTTPYVAISPEFLRGFPRVTGSGLVLVRAWREIRAMRPIAELDGLLVYRAEDFPSLTVRPWIAVYQDWNQARSDPALIPQR